MNPAAPRLTMQKVADQLGLSRMTVSSVVNGLARERGVKKETEQRVREHLKAIGYVPSIYARRLRKKDLPAVGVLHSGSLYSHLLDAYNRITNAIVASAGAADIVALPRHESREGLADFVGRGVPALIWIQNAKQADVQHEQLPDLLPYLAQFEKVVIYNHIPGTPDLESRLDELGIYRLVINRGAASRLAARFLADLGHTALAFPDAESGTLADPHGRDAETFRQAGFTRLIGLLAPGENMGDAPSPEWGVRHAERLAAAVREQGVTAAWIFDDETAGYTLARLAALGVRVPGDLTLLGFDGIPLGEAFSPPLTTVAVPVAEMTACALDLLHAAGARPNSLVRVFEPLLRERLTHGAPRPA